MDEPRRTIAAHSADDHGGCASRSRPDTTSHRLRVRRPECACCSRSSDRTPTAPRACGHARTARDADDQEPAWQRPARADQRERYDGPRALRARAAAEPSRATVGRMRPNAGAAATRLRPRPRRQVANRPLLVRSRSQSCAGVLPAQDDFSHSFALFLLSGGKGLQIKPSRGRTRASR